MATGEQESNPPDMDETVPPEAFSMVWVKVEIEEGGTVQGLDNEPADDDDDYTCPYENPDEEQNSEGDDSGQQFQIDFSENLKNRPQKRCRKRALPPNKRAPVDPNLKKFSCQFCDYKAMHKNALKYHTMKHTNEPPIACKFCDYKTKYPTSMKQHVLGQHTDKNDPAVLALPIYKCNLCEYTTRFKWNLAVHRRKHAAEKNFQCDLCGFASAHRHSFVKHVKRHEPKDNAMYQCDKCPFKTKYEGHISRHLAIIHKEVSEKATKCEYCEFSTRVRWRMNQHKKHSLQKTLVNCVVCGYASAYICEMRLHKKRHRYGRGTLKEDKQLSPSNFQVKKSISQNKSTATQNDASPMQAHQSTLPANTEHIHTMPTQKLNDEVTQPNDNPKIELPESPINIPDDKFYILDKFTEEIDWRKIEVVEVPGVEKMFHCKECDYNSKYKASVQRHFQRLHTSKDARPYRCLKCGFTTKTKDQISLHIKRSKSEILIDCNICNFLSYFKCQNAVHQKVHYPLKCTLCDYVCKQNYTMQEHFRIVHLGQSLQCNYCDYVATGKSNLLTHQNKHTCERNLSCHLCDYKTVRHRLLQVHIRKNHPDERFEPKIIADNKIASLLTTEEVPIHQLALENIVKNVQEHIKKFGEKLDNDEKSVSAQKNTDNEQDNDESVCPKIEGISVKMERADAQNQFHSLSEPQQEKVEPDNASQPSVVLQPNPSNFQMRYAESLNQAYYDSALRYASGSQHPHYYERW